MPPITLKDLQGQQQKLQEASNALTAEITRVKARLETLEKELTATEGAMRLNEHYMREAAKPEEEKPGTPGSPPSSPSSPPAADAPRQRKVVPITPPQDSGSDRPSSPSSPASPGSPSGNR